MKTLSLMTLFAGWLSLHSLASAGTNLADYTTIPDGQAAAYALAGTTVTGSANVSSGNVSGQRGLGIVGGTFPPTSDLSLDLGESMTIDYGQLVTAVTLTVNDIPPPGNVQYAFQAFSGATSLGTFQVPQHVSSVETKDLTALAGGLSFSRITLTLSVSAPAGLQIQSTTFTPVPEPDGIVLASLGAVACIAVLLRRKRLRSAL